MLARGVRLDFMRSAHNPPAGFLSKSLQRANLDRARRVFAAAVAAALVGACSPDAGQDATTGPDGPPAPYARCATAADCPDGTPCAEPEGGAAARVCRPVCRSAGDCPSAPPGTSGSEPVCLADGLCALACVYPAANSCPDGQQCGPAPAALCR